MIYTLLVAHFIGDFVLQSDWMAQNKSKRWDALGLHVGIWITTVAFAVALITPPSPYPYVELKTFGLFVLANGVAHFVQDAITSRINARLWAAKQVHFFFVSIGFDQLLHYVTLFVTAGWWLAQ